MVAANEFGAFYGQTPEALYPNMMNASQSRSQMNDDYRQSLQQLEKRNRERLKGMREEAESRTG